MQEKSKILHRKSLLYVQVQKSQISADWKVENTILPLTLLQK